MSTDAPIQSFNHSGIWFHRSIYYLAVGFMFAAAALRSILVYQESSLFRQVILLLGAWLLFLMGHTLLAVRFPWSSPILIGLEATLTLLLLLTTRSDFFAFLFAIIGMQAMQRYTPRVVGILIGLFTLLTFIVLAQSYGALQAVALALVFAAVSVFLAAYIWFTRRTRAVQEQEQALAGKLQEANRRLEFYSQQQAQLAASRERQRWARELHDSVTQTIFSMSLTAQSAVLLLECDKAQVAAQLDRMDQLTQNTLLEMQVLISGLAPAGPMDNGFLATLHQHLTDRYRLENLDVKLVVEGSELPGPMEEWGLLRIAREALNNIVKHAQVSQAVLRLHLGEPFWMEIEDRGRGFDVRMALSDAHLGLKNMRERAAEMGWDLQVSSSPGTGTCVRVEKRTEGPGKP